MKNGNQASEKVTFVLTSCGRPTLVKKTIESFLQHNTYPIETYLIVEDSENLKMKDWLEQQYGDRFSILFNKEKLGQIKSIDKAYAKVQTPLIFHCEDDWEFLRPNFIEDSLSIMNEDSKIITVNLRHLWETNGVPIEKKIQRTQDGVLFRYVVKEVEWNGFSFNPGLIRKENYLKIAPYASIGHEPEVNQAYKALGFYGAIVEEGVVDHLGDNHHLPIYEQSFVVRLKNQLKPFIPPVLMDWYLNKKNK